MHFYASPNNHISSMEKATTAKLDQPVDSAKPVSQGGREAYPSAIRLSGTLLPQGPGCKSHYKYYMSLSGVKVSRVWMCVIQRGCLDLGAHKL